MANSVPDHLASKHTLRQVGPNPPHATNRFKTLNTTGHCKVGKRYNNEALLSETIARDYRNGRSTQNGLANNSVL